MTVTAATPGTPITVTEVASVSVTSEYQLAGVGYTIEAPDSTATNPYLIVFTIDASKVPPGGASFLTVFRNGVAVPACNPSPPRPTGQPDPDPCMSQRATLTNGDVQITVLTSRASDWGVATFMWPFTGFFSPLENPTGSPNLLNDMQQGASVPAKFSLGGDRGLAILAPGSPTSKPIPCVTGSPTDAVEETTTSPSGLTYDAATGTYLYIWKSERRWTGTCRSLTIVLMDGSEHSVRFRFR